MDGKKPPVPAQGAAGEHAGSYMMQHGMGVPPPPPQQQKTPAPGAYMMQQATGQPPPPPPQVPPGSVQMPAPPPGAVRMPAPLPGHAPDAFASMGGMRMVGAPAFQPRQTFGAPDPMNAGMTTVFVNSTEQMDTLIKMVLNAIIKQDEDEVLVPYGVAKKAAACKGASHAPEDGAAGSDGRQELHRSEGGHAAAQSALIGAGVGGPPCDGDGGAGSGTNGAMDGEAGGLPGADMGDGGTDGKDEGEGGRDGESKTPSPDLIGILRSCLKKADEQPEAVLKKHVNKILRMAPFHMSSGPVYYYTPETPRNELERADRTQIVRGWMYRDPLSEEHVLRDGFARIPAMFRVHQDDPTHCKAALDALDAATQAVRALPHKKAMRGRRIKGSRGFKPLSLEEEEKDFVPGSETWSWKFFDDGRLQWCDRKERRWFKCSQCRFMKENRALVKRHFDISSPCSESWEQDRRNRPPEKEPREHRGRGKAARLSYAQGSAFGRSMPLSQQMAPALPDTHIKALIMIDALLDDGTFSPKQAQKMRWLCMWRQPPISVLMLAYGTNSELFGIRCTFLAPPHPTTPTSYIRFWCFGLRVASSPLSRILLAASLLHPPFFLPHCCPQVRARTLKCVSPRSEFAVIRSGKNCRQGAPRRHGIFAGIWRSLDRARAVKARAFDRARRILTVPTLFLNQRPSSQS